jgi:predicted molibdopterin-dependent oxidoreductase YjgC
MPQADADQRTPEVARGALFTVEVNGRPVPAHEGESVLGVLWAAGIRCLRITPLKKEPRGFLCGMGTCFDCLVRVDERLNVRACLEPARPGMRITTGSSDAKN